jgi:hypothetical protein
LSTCARIALYADDLLYIHRNRSADCDVHIQTDCDAICEHYKTLQLSINPSKTKLLHVVRARGRCSVSLPVVTVTGTSLVPVHSLKYLGVVFDYNFNYGLHTITNVCRVKKTVGFLVRVFRKALSRATWLLMYKVLCRVILLYCCETTYPTRACDRTALERCQKYCCRLILRNFDHNVTYDSMLTLLGLDPLYLGTCIRLSALTVT